MDRIRAIVYGAGMVNQIATRLMVERGVQVVGAINRSGPKVGVDLGTLAGLAQPLGVKVSDDPEAVLSIGADIVIVAVCDDMQRGYPIYKRCLERGLNVATVGTFMSYPWRQTPEQAEDLDSIAKTNGVTLVGTGNQDFFMVNLGLLMSGVCHKITRITLRNFSDVGPYGTEVAKPMGVGHTPETFDIARADKIPSIYLPFWENVIDGLGMRMRGIRQTTNPVVAKKDYYCGSLERTIRPGEIIGMLQRLDIDTDEGLPLVGENTLRLFDAHEEEYKEWIIEGEPDLQIRATRLDTAFTTASQPVNRIPDIINAEPGYLTLKDLPKLTFKHKPLGSYVNRFRHSQD